MASSVDTVFESLGSMTVLELVELKNKIEEEWGITAAAPVAVAAPAAGGADGGAPAEEKTSFDVVLTGAGAQKPVKEGVNQEEADSIKGQLEEAGASVELK